MATRMTHALRNFFIAVCTWLGITWLYRWFLKQRRPLVRVLVFHDVSNAEWFDRTIAHIVGTYTVLSPESFEKRIFNSQKINVLITFDDGYESWIRVCLPILERYKVQALFFVNSGLLDVSEDRVAREEYVQKKLLLSAPHETLSWDGVKEIRAKGHTIGGHTAHHERLSALNTQSQKNEIQDDKKRIESMLGETITMCAYPFGNRSDYTDVTIACVREAGYKCAFTTEPKFVTGNVSLQIPRLCIENNCTRDELSRWIQGEYDIFAKIKNVCVR